MGRTAQARQVFWYPVERAPGTTRRKSAIWIAHLAGMDGAMVLRTAPGVDDVSSWAAESANIKYVDPSALCAWPWFQRCNRGDPGEQWSGGAASWMSGASNFSCAGLVCSLDRRYRRHRAQGEDGVPVYLRDVARWWKRPRRDSVRLTRDGEKSCSAWHSPALAKTRKRWSSGQEQADIVRDALPGAWSSSRSMNAPIWSTSGGYRVRALIEGSILVAIVLFLSSASCVRPWS